MLDKEKEKEMFRKYKGYYVTEVMQQWEQEEQRRKNKIKRQMLYDNYIKEYYL